MKRIIYVIPYVSIIRQTVGIFENIFGERNVLGHYGTADFGGGRETGERSPAELAAENWDKPIIVTTNVQFFESLHAAKPSHCRKPVSYTHLGNERGVGEGVRTCGVPRAELFVVSKVAAENKSYETAARSIDETLEKMGLDYLDMMIIHSPQPWAEWRGENRYFAENREVWRCLLYTSFAFSRS